MTRRLAISLVLAGACIGATLYAFDSDSARCDRAGLSTWRAAASFCLDTHTGAIHAPSFRKER